MTVAKLSSNGPMNVASDKQGRGKGIHEVSTGGRSWQVDGYEPKGGLVEDTSADNSNP